MNLAVERRERLRQALRKRHAAWHGGQGTGWGGNDAQLAHAAGMWWVRPAWSYGMPCRASSSVQQAFMRSAGLHEVGRSSSKQQGCCLGAVVGTAQLPSHARQRRDATLPDQQRCSISADASLCTSQWSCCHIQDLITQLQGVSTAPDFPCSCYSSPWRVWILCHTSPHGRPPSLPPPATTAAPTAPLNPCLPLLHTHPTALPMMCCMCSHDCPRAYKPTSSM
eukprot:366145-Chlamydomonas_euryale.AAC.7